MPGPQVVVSVLGNLKGLTDALDGAEKKTAGFGSKIESAGKKMTVFATVPIVGFLANATKGASNLNEVVSKSNTVFGASASSIREWATGAAKNIGLSEQAAYDAAGGLGNMFTQLGLTTEKAAEMSTGIVNLSADFASFHNADISDVIAAQSAAFRGEYDSLQRFLPLINAATVEQTALEMTGKKATSELTAQDKALAVHKLMLEGAGPALGDFNRTSDSMANKQRIAAAEVQNTSDRMGKALLPAMTSVTGFVADTLIPTLDNLSGNNGALVLLGVAAAGPVLSNVTKLITAIKALNVELALTAVRATAALGAIGIVIAGIHEVATTEGGLAEKILGPSPVSRFIGKIPGLAGGGGVSARTPYVVGERGPELFVPGRSGTIVPNGASGATFNITVNGAVDKAGTARELEEILYSYVRAGGNLRFT
jgi:hypothetical protein